jgi:nicotinamidase-related amidase
MKAAVFVDVQNDFVEGGALPYNWPDYDVTKDIIDFAHECRSKGYMMYATVDTHDEFYEATHEGKLLPIKHCIASTTGHQIIDGLVKDVERNVIIPQGHIFDTSTFGSYKLIEKMHEHFPVDECGMIQQTGSSICEPLDEIIICGFKLSVAVLANAVMLRSKFPEVNITVRVDLCGDVDSDAYEAAIMSLKMQHINVEGLETTKSVFDCIPPDIDIEAIEHQDTLNNIELLYPSNVNLAFNVEQIPDLSTLKPTDEAPSQA